MNDKCPNCKGTVWFGQEQVCVDANNMPVFNRFAYCDSCKMKWNLDLQPNKKSKRKSAPVNPATGQRKINTIVLDVFCILSLVACVFMTLFGKVLISYGISLAWLILYYELYYHFNKRGYDAKEQKTTMITIAVFFVLEFGIGFVFV